ncbi:MAG: permease [Actinomycetota bacterium]|nr:permease [Actinomycetota bacterium]
MKNNNKKSFNLKKFLKQYMFFFITLILLGIIFIFRHDIGLKVINSVIYSSREIILVLPPIFILIGLLDEWVSKETMIKLMGEDSGIKGIILSFFIGIMTVGPLYSAFPIAEVFIKKNVKFTNIIVFIGASSAIRVPMFLVEISSLGFKFALTRLFLNIILVLLIAYIMSSLLKQNDITAIYEKVIKM